MSQNKKKFHETTNLFTGNDPTDKDKSVFHTHKVDSGIKSYV